MHTRREFLDRTAALGMAAAAGAIGIEAAAATRLDRLGVGLFTIPTLLERDFAGTMKTLAAIGYKEVETFGPYSWSAQSALDRWKVISQSLAFKGSGYFGRTAKEIRSILDGAGLTSPSMHTDLGFKYHNHGYGFRPIDGVVPFELLVDRSDPAVVDLQMDLYWTKAAGPQWIALFPYIADAGSGVLDLARVLAAAKRSGVEQFFLERDQTPTPDERLRGSYKYLSSLALE